MNFIIMFRIKTLAEIGEQHDRIVNYLDAQGRIDTLCRINRLYGCIMGRILDRLGIDEFDDDALEWIFNEPLIVGTDY